MVAPTAAVPVAEAVGRRAVARLEEGCPGAARLEAARVEAVQVAVAFRPAE